MAIHDWTRVGAGIFHDFHHEWISTIKNALNGGLLPPDHYALAEQISGGLGPDVVTLDLSPPPETESTRGAQSESAGGGAVALAEAAPKVSFHARAEADLYAAKASRVTIRHVSNHRVVLPGNKSARTAIQTFARKAAELIRAGMHLIVIDLFPPGPRDPQGLHRLIWDELTDNDFTLPADRPLTIAACVGGLAQEAFVEFAAVEGPLPSMPLFLRTDLYVNVPLEATYQAAWKAVPAVWKQTLEPAAEGKS